MGFKGYSLEKDYYGEKWWREESWQELLLVGGALKAGLFDALEDKPLSSEQIARILRVNSRAVQITLEALADRGYVERKGEIYKLTPEAYIQFKDKNSSHYIGSSIIHSLRLVERWLTLPQVIKTGEAVVGDRFTEGIENFVRAMDHYSRPIAFPVVKICFETDPNIKSLIDIGGGLGTFSKAFVRKGIEVTLFDLPEVIDLLSLEQRENKSIKLIAGDFNQNLPPGPFDFAFLGNITHIYNSQENRSLFRRIASILKEEGHIGILDFLQGRSSSGSFFGVNMLVNTGTGGTWKEKEYRSWLEESGFKEPKIYNLKERDQQLIIARKSKLES